MFLIIFAILGMLSVSQCEEQRIFTSTQHRSLISSYEDGPIRLIHGEGVWPSFINFTEPIEVATGIYVRMIFRNDTDIVYPKKSDENRMSICKMLSNALDDKNSYAAKLMMPESLGLYGTRCPIKAGIRNLNPYKFPKDVHLERYIGEGFRTYVFTIEDSQKKTDDLLKLEVDMNLEQSSSSAAIAPSFLTITLFAFAIFQSTL